MELVYLSLSYLPSRRASGIQVMRMCAALARAGHRVTLVAKGCPGREEPGVDDVFAFYGVAPTFEIERLGRPAMRGGGLLYLWRLRRLLRGLGGAVDLVWARDPLGAWLAARRGLPVLLEAHEPPENRWARRLHATIFAAPAFRRLVVISAALGRRFAELDLGAPAPVVCPDGAEAPRGSATAPARRPGRPPRLGYVGQLYPGKGIETILALAARLPETEIHVVGGGEAELTRLRAMPPPANVVLHGFVPPGALASHYGRFDLLLAPYGERVAGASGRSDLAPYMSPLKIFEYMAAGRPIVASDLPVLREVLDDGRNALLAAPGDVESWAAAIGRLLADRRLAERLAAAARDDLARRYTWDARVRRGLDGL